MWAVREVDHLFARLGRYTRFVVYSKWSLLALALLLVSSLIAWPLLTRDRSGLRISFVDQKTADGEPSSPVMKNPEYRGVGADGQHYKINGASATQKTPGLMIIETVEAQMLRADGGWYSLSADRAEYRQDRKQIELLGNVTVIDGTANQFITSRATIETEESRVYGNEEVYGSGDLGNILANGFEINDKGNHIRFVGDSERQLKVTMLRAKKK